ncbi:hypothetical protein CPB86DRAFT_825792 [Serendipita vermifera]|nr:hypothetical protein CPB86DRAFT_825792 [Serendipita vermifera]
MNEESSSAMKRVPEEVWWMILDEAIDLQHFFPITYEGDDWSEYTRMSGAEEYDPYLQSEVQRKTIGSVCRSWQIVARSRRFRYASLVNTMDWDIDTTRKARSVFLYGSDVLDSHLAQGPSVEWVTLGVGSSQMLNKVASMLSCPRIRRLNLHFFSRKDSLPDTPNKFPEITWLDCDVSECLLLGSTSTNQRPIVLPKLEVFRCKCGYNFISQLSGFILPSLRFIYLHFKAYMGNTPTLDMLLPFRQSIQSVVLRVYGDRIDMQNNTLQFPSWNDFPNLKELELEMSWAFHFEALPPDHPLQKLNARHGNFDALPSLVQGSNMRQLILQDTRWTVSGELVRGLYETKLDTEKAADLWENAKARNIRFEVSEDGKVFRDREEAIAAAFAANPFIHLEMSMK